MTGSQGVTETFPKKDHLILSRHGPTLKEHQRHKGFFTILRDHSDPVKKRFEEAVLRAHSDKNDSVICTNFNVNVWADNFTRLSTTTKTQHANGKKTWLSGRVLFAYMTLLRKSKIIGKKIQVFPSTFWTTLTQASSSSKRTSRQFPVNYNKVNIITSEILWLMFLL